MSLRRARIFIDEGEREKRQRIKTSVSKVLAIYPKYVLVKANQDQIDSLKSQGFRLEVQKQQMIKLRTVEFDPSKEVPSPPPKLRLSAAEIKRRRKNYWIVQFVGPVKPEWAEKIRALGGKLHGYIPENAFLVDMTLQAKEKVEKLSFVDWVGLYEPAYKISPLLMGRRKKASPSELSALSVDTEAFKPTPVGNINVVLYDPADLRKVSQEIEKLGGTVVATGKDLIRASLDPSKIDKVAKMVEVKWIEPYQLPELFNDVAAAILGVRHVWDNHGLDGEGQNIAVADTGLDTGVNDASMHDDFEGRIVNIHSWPIPPDLHQYLDNTTWDDEASDVSSGHGTHVAGSVLGNGTNSGGSLRGMVYKARLVMQAVEQWADWKPVTGWLDDYYLLGIPDDLNDLFQQAYDDKARIHTNSWGNRLHGQYTAESQQIDKFIWDHKDMVILFAAGNDGEDANRDGVVDNDSLSSQSCAKNCITVGASENNRTTGGLNPGGACSTYHTCFPRSPTNPTMDRFPVNPIRDDRLSDDPEGMAAFSSRGPTDDGRTKPDMVAPGTNILSVRSSVASGTGHGLLPVGDPNRPYYMYMGGTSMATPLTAGTVALIRQYLEKVCLHTNPTAALLKAILIHGASPLAGQYTPPEVGAIPDNNQGWGRVSLTGSLFPDYPVKMKFKDDPADVLETGDYREFSFNVVNGTVPFRATLVWTDFPSTLAAGGGLYNTLGLSVICPDGTIERSPDNNNVQQVVIDNPQVGEYKVRVDGINIPTYVSPVAVVVRKQDFALVVSGGLEFVDVYIRDNDADNGMEPSKGGVMSPDIWVSLDNNPDAPHVKPKEEQTNYVFVKVHNRGSKEARNAEVRLYWAYHANPSRPHWRTDDIKVDGVLGNVRHVDVPAHDPAGDGEAITAAFEWIPPGRDRYCLFATVNHPEDPLLQEDVDVVRWEDNLARQDVDLTKKICPIAMVAHSSMLALHVQFLREFRDEIVLKSTFKDFFKRLLDRYYQFSPTIAEKMEEIPQFRRFFKYSIVYPFVFYAKALAFLALAIRGKQHRQMEHRISSLSK